MLYWLVNVASIWQGNNIPSFHCLIKCFPYSWLRMFYKLTGLKRQNQLKIAWLITLYWRIKCQIKLIMISIHLLPGLISYCAFFSFKNILFYTCDPFKTSGRDLHVSLLYAFYNVLSHVCKSFFLWTVIV